MRGLCNDLRVVKAFLPISPPCHILDGSVLKSTDFRNTPFLAFYHHSEHCSSSLPAAPRGSSPGCLLPLVPSQQARSVRGLWPVSTLRAPGLFPLGRPEGTTLMAPCLLSAGLENSLLRSCPPGTFFTPSHGPSPPSLLGFLTGAQQHTLSPRPWPGTGVARSSPKSIPCVHGSQTTTKNSPDSSPGIQNPPHMAPRLPLSLCSDQFLCLPGDVPLEPKAHLMIDDPEKSVEQLQGGPLLHLLRLGPRLTQRPQVLGRRQPEATSHTRD